MTYQYNGSCSCQSVKISIELSKSIDCYKFRACDCDFCVPRGIEYLSDPKGKLFIENDSPLKIVKQDSNNADFLLCEKCHDVIAASYQSDNTRSAALNAKLLDNYNALQGSDITSPKNLSAEEKINRWKSLWLCVSIKH